MISTVFIPPSSPVILYPKVLPFRSIHFAENAALPAPLSDSVVLQPKSSEVTLPDKQSQSLQKTQQTFLAATAYQPTYRQLGSSVLPVHNAEIAKRLQSSYTPQAFNNLFEFSRQKGVFNVRFVSQNGLLKTAGTTAEEDSSMGRAHWISDTLYARDLVRALNPELWRKSLNALATYYASEKPAFERNIREPERYHTGAATEGVAHIFEPDTLKRFTDWAVNYRLESHGLALKAFCDQFKEDILSPNGSSHWDTPAERQNKIEAMTNLAHYFQALGYPKARSCGPWEERPAAGGATSDIDAVRSGYESLSDLMFNPAYAFNPEIQQLRNDVKRQERQLTTTVKPVDLPPLFDSQAPLKKLMTDGTQTVRQRLLAPNGPQEMPGSEEMDSALTLVAHSNLSLGDTVESDVQNHLRVLDQLKAGLERDNGMVRYVPHTVPSAEINKVDQQPRRLPFYDSYLGPNFDLAAMPNGRIPPGNKVEGAKKDVVDHKFEMAKKTLIAQNPSLKERPEELGFMASRQLGMPGREAERFLVSDLSTGYGKQVEKLLNQVQKQNRVPSESESKMIQYGLTQETDALNRAYARITGTQPTGQPWLKANGNPCPPYRVPEAYQAVSTLDKNGQPGPLKMIPGINTPLTWAAASLYSASLQMQRNLNRLANVNLPATS